MTGADDLRGGDPGRGPVPDEPPPILGSWTRLYAAVLGWLAILVVLFYIIITTFVFFTKIWICV
mgnify:CR=1 FL=1